MLRLAMLVVLALASPVACAPAAPQTGGGADQTQPAPTRTLVAAIRVELNSLATVPLQTAGVARYFAARLFNAELANLDPRGDPLPYLAETLPQLNTQNWQVFPDGRMETIYHLRPNLTWQDGTPFSAEDFFFGWRAYTNPGLGFGNLQPFSAIEEVNAPDARTLVIRWRRPYPDAAVLSGRTNQFAPLPRHILDGLLPDVAAFSNNPYWTRDYIGVGPYRLEHWEPGAYMDAVAFDGHILGRPKIPRIKVLFMPDANTALAAMLTGDVQLSADTSLRLEQETTLKKEWSASGGGTILDHPNQWRAIIVQLRPELVTPRGLLDVRVRKALAHAIDRQGISDALYAGEGIFSDFIVAPDSQWGRAAEGSIVRYPYDPRRTGQLMTEAGYTRGTDGTWANPANGRFVVESMGDSSADNVAENSIVSAQWRQAGFDVQEAVLSIVLAQDPQARATFSGLYTQNTNNSVSFVPVIVTPQTPSADSHWAGQNRGAWSNPEYDRLATAFTSTLDPKEREQQMAAMARIFTDELPYISLYFRTQPWAFVTGITGLQLVGSDSNMSWNIYEWEFH